MILYHMSGACSLAVHAALLEIGRPFSVVRVDTDTGHTDTGIDYATLNPNGYVPALALHDGSVRTETGAILEYLSDAYPEALLEPVTDLVARAKLNALLYFIASELHPRFSVLFGQPQTTERARIIDKLSVRIGFVEHLLSDGRTFLNGHGFTVADVYAFAVLSWCDLFDMNLALRPHTKAFLTRLKTRPSVQKALQADARA